jgi:circadian clock protein KaiC
VQKLRGVKFKEGLHDFDIQTGRVGVYPRLVPAAHVDRPSSGQVASGIRELDALLGGGLDRGTSTLVMGPAGSGKSTLATQYAVAAAESGGKAAMYIFDERLNTIIERSAGLGLDLRAHLATGKLTIRSIDPMELTPGKFAHLVQESVDQGATTLVIDSLTGYAASMGDEAHLSLQIRNLLSFLGEKGVTTILVSVQHGLMGDVATQAGYISYIADTVVLLRYYEHRGEVKRALSVFKRRAGAHERTIRDIEFSARGIKVGKPLTEFRGVLTGVPEYTPGRGSG